MIAKNHAGAIVMLAALGMAQIAMSATDSVSRWKFNDGMGTNTVDSATGTNYGLLVNMNTNTCWTNGVVGKALSFDGSNDYVNCGNGARLSISNEITIEAWVKPQRLYNYQLIATKGWYSYVIGLYGNNAFMYILPSAGSGILLYGQTVLASNQWYHLTATYRPGIARLYVNGQLDGVATSVVAGVRTNNSWLSIGSESSYYDNYFFKGVIDDLRIYNRALDAEEIRGHYQGESNSRGQWEFNEGVGAIASDTSGAGNTGALTNMNTNVCWVAGVKGKALNFDGVNDYVLCANDPTLCITNEITIEALVNPQVLYNYQLIATKGWYSYVIGLYGNRAFMYIKPSAGSGILLYGQTVLASNQWHHLAATYRPGVCSLYVNGQPDGVNTCVVSGINNIASGLSIGSESSYYDNYFFNGIIDNLRIYDRVLTPDELYNACRDGFTCGQWRFDEGSGALAYDASGAGNHGVLSNMNTAACWVQGTRGTALQFDGADDVVACTNAGSLSATNEVSVEAWVKPDTSADYHTIVCRGTNTYFLAVNSGKAYFAVGKADGSDWNATAEGATTLDSTRWYHLAGTYSHGTARVYVNAVQDGIGTGAVEPVYAASTSLTIGAAGTDGGNTYFFNGTIDDVRVYKRALTLNDLYRNYIGGNLCGHWRFDEGVGTVAGDGSGMGNTGTLVNVDSANCWVDGTIGRGLALDGTNDYVNCGNKAGLSVSNEISVSAWVKPDTRSGYHVIAAKNNFTYFLATSSGKPYFAIGRANRSGWNVSILGTNVLDSSRWVHIVGTYNKTNGVGRLYVNGVLDSAVTGTAESIGTSTAYLSLGSFSSYTADYFFQGTLDEIRIHDREMAADEIYAQCQNEGGEYGFGCEGNPTGNPIGGGAGYSDVVTSYTYYVSTVSELTNALANATSGQVVYVDDAAELDLTGYDNIIIPGGVTLASGRGVSGSSGALLCTTTADTFPLFMVDGENVRVTGLRLQGSSSVTNIIGDYDISMGICSYDPGLEVDNCEISDWPYTGILLNPGATGAYIHHNYIHHCQQMGYGYGVCLGYCPPGSESVESVIEANLFDYMRHSIASTGMTNESYEARYNLVLENATSHSFDQHARDYGGTSYAGGSTYIHHNTFKTQWAICIRGMPYVGAWIHNNWFDRYAAEMTARQLVYVGAGSNTEVYINVFTTNRVLEVETIPEHIYYIYSGP